MVIACLGSLWAPGSTLQLLESTSVRDMCFISSSYDLDQQSVRFKKCVTGKFMTISYMLHSAYYIIESVDSISRDGPDTPIYILHNV